MGFQNLFNVGHFAVAIGDQDSLTEEPAEWEWLRGVLMPQVSWDAAQADVEGTTQTRGAALPPSPGHVWPKIVLRARLPGQPKTYVAASSTPSITGIWKLIHKLCGTALVEYAAANVTTPTSAKEIACAAAAKRGCLLGWLDGDGRVSAAGFVKGISGPGPHIHQLLHDLAALPAADQARIPTLTLFPGTTQPQHQGVRVCGQDASQDYRFIGLAVDSLTFKPDADRSWWVDIETTAYGGARQAADGGLKTVSANYHDLPPRLGAAGARTVLASNVLAGLNDGTADHGTCEVLDLALKVAFSHYPVECPTAPQGVGDVVYQGCRTTASFSVPKLPDYDVAGENIFERAWRQRTPIALAEYLGDVPGRVFAWAIRAGFLTSFPKWVEKKGSMHQELELVAGDYLGDDAANDAGNKSLVIAIG